LKKKIEQRKSNKNILIIGPTPPPVGGVAVYVDRLYNLLKQNYNVKLLTYHLLDGNRFFNKLKLMKIIIQSLRFQPDIIYSNMTDRYLMPFLILLNRIRGVKVIQHIHSYRVEQHNLIKKSLIFTSTLLSTIVVVPSKALIETLNRVYKKNLNLKKIFVVPSYLSTKYSSVLHKTTKILPSEVENFFSTHNPVIVANAYKIVLINNKDIYGIKDSVLLLEEIRKHFPNAGLIFFLPNIGEYNYFQLLNKLLKAKRLSKHFIWVTDPVLFLNVLKRSTLFIRPTLTDSYGISITEALELGVPAVASDICERAKGTVLYKTGSFKDLLKKTKQVLEKIEYYRYKVKKSHTSDSSEDIINLIESL